MARGREMKAFPELDTGPDLTPPLEGSSVPGCICGTTCPNVLYARRLEQRWHDLQRENILLRRQRDCGLRPVPKRGEGVSTCVSWGACHHVGGVTCPNCRPLLEIGDPPPGDASPRTNFPPPPVPAHEHCFCQTQIVEDRPHRQCCLCPQRHLKGDRP